MPISSWTRLAASLVTVAFSVTAAETTQSDQHPESSVVKEDKPTQKYEGRKRERRKEREEARSHDERERPAGASEPKAK